MDRSDPAYIPFELESKGMTFTRAAAELFDRAFDLMDDSEAVRAKRLAHMGVCPGFDAMLTHLELILAELRELQDHAKLVGDNPLTLVLQ